MIETKNNNFSKKKKNVFFPKDIENKQNSQRGQYFNIKLLTA